MPPEDVTNQTNAVPAPEPSVTPEPPMPTPVSESTVDDALPEVPEEPTQPPYSWQASEYAHHHKGATWYVGLAVIVVVLLAVAVVLKLWLSLAVFAVMGIAIAVYAHKPPRVLTYQLDSKGITIEGKLYPYTAFRSFAVLSDISWHLIDLEPTQRFMPRLSVLFGDEDFDAIVDHLSEHLPRVDRDPDLVERLTRYLRF